MSANKNLRNAKKAKNDEFYTQLTDIEKEMKHYRNHFEDKIIYLNCDDPQESNFWRFFALNFDFLKLKKLISTHYNEEAPTYKMTLDRDENGEMIDYGRDSAGVPLGKVEPLTQNGDFRSDESIDLLKESDIVVTNPPFSLFREYVAQLIEHKKHFLIIGNYNAVTYKEIFPLFKENKMWVGVSPRSMEFKTPSGEMKSVNACWFTNLDVSKRHEDIILFKQFNEKDYPKYDNYDAIEVSNVANIPEDYDGVMGVPITFLTRYNPEQFKIIGSRRWSKSQELLDVYTGDRTPPEDDKKTTIGGKETYDRIFIKKRGE